MWVVLPLATLWPAYHPINSFIQIEVLMTDRCEVSSDVDILIYSSSKEEAISISFFIHIKMICNS